MFHSYSFSHTTLPSLLIHTGFLVATNFIAMLLPVVVVVVYICGVLVWVLELLLHVVAAIPSHNTLPILQFPTFHRFHSHNIEHCSCSYKKYNVSHLYLHSSLDRFQWSHVFTCSFIVCTTRVLNVFIRTLLFCLHNYLV